MELPRTLAGRQPGISRPSRWSDSTLVKVSWSIAVPKVYHYLTAAGQKSGHKKAQRGTKKDVTKGLRLGPSLCAFSCLFAATLLLSAAQRSTGPGRLRARRRQAA